MQLLKKVYSQNNNEITLISAGVFCPSGQKTPAQKTILIIGVVHGDEPQGKFLIENYLESMQIKNGQINQKNNLLFIPCLNPDGLKLGIRQNASEIDINRNFPTKNWTREPFASEYFGGEECASEIETKFVIDILEEFSPDVILTLHAPFKVVNYDGPAKEIAEKISEIINYPVQSDIGYATPGSFGTYAGVERNIPIITLELDEEINVKGFITPMNKIFDYLSSQ